MGKYEKQIAKPFEWGGDQIAHHKMGGLAELGPLVAFLNKEMVEGADLNIFVHHISVKSDEGPDYVTVHAHDVSQAYVFPDEGLEFEVTFEDEKYTVNSPATVFIPPGVKHNLKIVQGSGIEVCILRKGWYD